MKPTYPKTLTLGFAVLCLLVQACQSGSSSAVQATEEAETTAEATKPAYQSPAAFQAQVGGVWQAYLSLKDALVASEAAQAREKAGMILNALQKVDSTSLALEARPVWVSQARSLQTDVEANRASQEVGQQRAVFERVSKEMYDLVKNWGASGGTVYKQFCPMALGNKGAFWLSAEKQIRNPYFGDAMLQCGEVQDELRFRP